MLKIEDKIDQPEEIRGLATQCTVDKKPLNFDSILYYEYHLYSSEGQRLIYIYMYRNERIYKEPIQ
jgi:hypothetical protein